MKIRQGTNAPIDIGTMVMTTADAMALGVRPEGVINFIDGASVIAAKKIGSTDETYEADDETWNRVDDGATTNGVVDTRLVRIGYDSTRTPPKLMGYYRNYTYDALGRLVDVSEETAVEIDAPVSCEAEETTTTTQPP